ncbi:hypothetical protein Bca4012_065363 [Brassica carinata]
MFSIVLLSVELELGNAKVKNGHVYGLASAQYREHAPSARVPSSLVRNLELEMSVSGLETSLQTVTADVSVVKEDVATMKKGTCRNKGCNQSAPLIQSLLPQQAATAQQQSPPTQAQDPSAQPSQANGI